MIRHITFPAHTTAELAKRIESAGEGAVLRLIPKGTDDGAIKFYLAVRSAKQLEEATPDGDCDPDLNESYICPPRCP